MPRSSVRRGASPRWGRSRTPPAPRQLAGPGATASRAKRPWCLSSFSRSSCAQLHCLRSTPSRARSRVSCPVQLSTKGGKIGAGARDGGASRDGVFLASSSAESSALGGRGRARLEGAAPLPGSGGGVHRPLFLGQAPSRVGAWGWGSGASATGRPPRVFGRGLGRAPDRSPQLDAGARVVDRRGELSPRRERESGATRGRCGAVRSEAATVSSGDCGVCNAAESPAAFAVNSDSRGSVFGAPWRPPG